MTTKEIVIKTDKLTKKFGDLSRQTKLLRSLQGEIRISGATVLVKQQR